MSLGFLTESALMPSKAKPIKVGGKSMIDLKALVYEREQKLRTTGGDDDANRDLRALRGKRARELAEVVGRKDVFARSNKGLEERQQKDEEAHDTAKKVRQRSQKMLEAKAKVYEQIASGQVTGAGTGLLVDFSQKTEEDIKRLRKRPLAQDASESSDVEVVNTFGRSRQVKRGSREHKEWLKEQEAIEEANRIKLNYTNTLHTANMDPRYSFRGNYGAPQETHGAPEATQHVREADAPEDLAQSAHDFIASVVFEATQAAETAPPAPAKNEGQWAWGTGQGRADTGDWETREGEERQAAKVMADLLERAGGSAPDVDNAMSKMGGRVISQWERTLNVEQKSFLQEVHQETLAGRKAVEDRKQQKEDRRELLRRKQQERLLQLAQAQGPPAASVP